MIEEYYFVIKAIHIISVICWMCGLLYLPRLFVYHTYSDSGSESYKTFCIMEQKLSKLIMTPSMIATFISGLLLLHIIGFEQKWIHVKLLLVIMMAGYHGVSIKHMKNFTKFTNTKSSKYFRFFNEVPAVLMVCIVFLAVLKPF